MSWKSFVDNEMDKIANIVCATWKHCLLQIFSIVVPVPHITDFGHFLSSITKSVANLKRKSIIFFFVILRVKADEYT